MGDWLIPAAIIITVVIISVLYFYPSYTAKLDVLVTGPFDLSAEKTLVQASDSKALLAPEFTFQAFVYVNPIMKTGEHVKCGTDQNQPSCADGAFQPCLCDPSGCISCLDRGYNSLINLFGIATLEIMPVPDASRQGAIASQLYIKTEMVEAAPPATPRHHYYIETISLPAITAQKWTMITIARDGRQFYIYYNDVLVKTQKTMYMPISELTQTNLTGVVSGSKGLIGTVANVKIYSKRRTVTDVEADYKTRADTRGAPYLNSKSTVTTLTTPSLSMPSMDGILPDVEVDWSFMDMFNLPKLSLCLTGNCKAPAITSKSNKIWVSSYA